MSNKKMLSDFDVQRIVHNEFAPRGQKETPKKDETKHQLGVAKS